MSQPSARVLTSAPRAATPDEAEHREATARARRIVVVGGPAWLLAVPLDVVAGTTLAPGSLSSLLALRLAGSLIIAATWLVLRFAPGLGPRGLRALLVTAFTAMGALFGVAGAIVGGLRTPYFGGALVVVAGYALASHVRWRQGAVDAAIVALGFPLTLVASALVVPSIGAQFASGNDRASLIFDVTNLASMYAMSVIGGHLIWSLRRQVFVARSLGRYRLKERIGEGGMGEVWIAYHDGLKRDVAVKILRTSHLRDAKEATARFEREVHATAELTHPNIVRVLDYGATDDGLWYYVMELLLGENLGQLVLREGAQPPARAIHIVEQAASALAEAHAKGIVHRDVKPENLFLTQAGLEGDFVKVVDFGIARVAKAEDETKLTADGRVLGTPLWMSPEGIAAKPLGPAADVYALGAVLYLLLSGRPPFSGDSVAALAYGHLSLAPPPLPAEVPADLQALVVRCLAKRPEERYPTANALALALASCPGAGTWRGRTREGFVAAAPSPVPSAGVDALGKTEGG